MKRMYGRALSMLLVLLLSLSLVTPAFAAGKTWSFEQTGEIATQPETSEPQWGRDPSKPSGTLRDAVETWCTNAPEGQKSKFYSLDLGNKSQCSVGEVYKSGDKWKCDVTVYYQPFLDKCNRDYTNKDHILAVGESESKTLTLTWNDSFDFQPDHWDYGYVQFKVTHGPHTPAAPTINDLSKITVKVSCTNTVMGHASKSYNLANASEYTLGEVMKSGNDYICNVTVNGSVFVGYYGDSHTLTGDATKTVRMKYDSTAKAWKVDGTLPVEFTVVCETPVAPQPVATDLIKNVVVDCTNDVMNHADATYGLLDGSYTVNVTGTYPTVTGTITVSADKYVAEYNKTNAGHTLSSDSPVVVNLTYDFTTGIWTANTDTVKFEVVCETPVAPQPVATDLIKNVVVDCTNDVMNHADATYGLLDGSYTVNVTGTYPTVTGTITVSADKYVAEYNKTNAGHTLSSDSPVVVNLTYDFTTGIWTANTDTVKFEVACTTPHAPEMPTEDELKAMIQVKVDCISTNSHKNDPCTFALMSGTYGLSPITGNARDGYTTTITIFAKGVTGEGGYVKEYNRLVSKGHVLSGDSQVKLTLANDGNGWYVKPYSREITTVTFYVKHGYTVTYEWKGDYPYGAVPPVDSNVYEYGDLATVAAAPKDMKWNSKDGGWKWDSVRERWYWVDNGAYWYGDKINGVEGYWAFTGWEREVWVEATRWERGHYETEYLRPGSKIEITEDTVIYGTWEFRPVGGTVVLNKTVKAPAGFKGDDTYTFEIYDSKDAKKPVKTVKVEAGKNVYVSLPNGTYYIYEVNAAVKGYDLDVTVKGDISAEGEKIVLRNDAVYVNFVNTYTDEYTGPKLNDNDHFAYIVGYPDGTARPEGNITREEVATIFFRLLTDESRAKFLSDYNTFSDVSSNRWSNTAISTLVNAGILKGYPDGTFRPAGYITRAEMATIIAKFANLSGARDNFTDITNHWANAYIRSAASNGWVSGYPDGRFCPDQFITRAETMAMINRVLTRNPDSPSDLLPNMVTFTDNLNTNAWYYLHVQEAANGHTYDREKNGTEYWVALTR